MTPDDEKVQSELERIAKEYFKMPSDILRHKMDIYAHSYINLSRKTALGRAKMYNYYKRVKNLIEQESGR